MDRAARPGASRSLSGAKGLCFLGWSQGVRRVCCASSPLYSQNSHKCTQIYTQMSANTCCLFLHTHTHAPPPLLLGAGWCLCLVPEGPCHKPEWTPCPHTDSFRATFVPPGLSGSCPGHQLGSRGGTWARTEHVQGRRLTPSQLGPEGSLQQQPLSD